ncbi:MAG: ACT domain-containing protein [Candidatus Omnitrophica bacterium]|nr:ACT domain-containing protein [Candidatus Omnitrophota bacterium]
MIKRVRTGKEIIGLAPNRPGVLEGVAKLLADKGISILAIAGQVTGNISLIRVVVDDHLHARDLFRKKRIHAEENPVVLVETEDRPGALLHITRKLAERKVNINAIYGSSAATYQPCLLVISTDDFQKAMVALRES